MKFQLRTPILAVLVSLPLEWNTYLLYLSDIVNFVWKTDEEGRGGEGSRKHCLINFCSLAVLQSSVGEGCCGKKTYWGTAEIATFSKQNLRRSNKHDSFWHIVSTGYFHILFLWVIVVSNFIPLESYKNLDPPLFSITFTVNSHKYLFL